MESFPIVIIGAGPAGLSTALHLVRSDPSWVARLVVLDRAAHPRHKLCGGGLTRFGLDVLRDLDIPIPLPIPHATVNDARFTYRNRTVHVRGNPEFVVFHRQAFDHLLARIARARGIRIDEHVRVTRIVHDAGGVDVITDKGLYRAGIAIGADGSRGITRTTLAKTSNLPKGNATRTARLLEVVHPAGEQRPQFDGRYAEFNFSTAGGELQGYGWDFPTVVAGAPHHNRGVYDARMAPRRPRAALPDALEKTLDHFGTDPKTARVEGHPIHWFSPFAPIRSNRLLLVGDAAGAEPLFGEGIAIALGYGKIAAETIGAAERQGSYNFKDYKRRLLLSRLGFYMLIRWWTAWWSYRLSDRAWFMHTMWTIGKGLAWVSNRLKRDND